MLLTLDKLLGLLSSTSFLFICLLFINYFLFYVYFRVSKPTLKSGAFLMACAMFSLVVMPELAAPFLLRKLIILELLVIWFLFIFDLIQAELQAHKFMSYTERISVGSWVTATAILALCLKQVAPRLHGVIILLGLLAVFFWLYYLTVLQRLLVSYYRKHGKMQITCTILLVALSTQIITILLSDFFLNHIPEWIYQSLVLIGCADFIVGVFLAARYTILLRKKYFIVLWPNANTLIYGVLSASGLAALGTDVFSFYTLTFIWWCAFILFLFIELIELMRLGLRIQIKGLSKSISYNRSQWLRVFSLSVFYGYTLSYYELFDPKNNLIAIISAYGQYVIALILILQLSSAFQLYYEAEKKLLKR